MADKFSDSLSSDHLQLKIPTGDSPYVKAKHVQLVEKDPNRAVALFWRAINSADRVDSALKDMAVVMKQLNRSEEAIEAIKSFRGLCSVKAQEPLDNVLLDLYKKCGRVTEQIDLLNHKLRIIDEGTAFGGKMMKTARSQGKKFHITVEQEKSRLLGNLAWAYMQCENYEEAEPLYRRALEIERDCNKMCNLAICLMQTGRIAEAKILLADVRRPSNYSNGESYEKSFNRAWEMMNGSEGNEEASMDPEAFLSPVSEKVTSLHNPSPGTNADRSFVFETGKKTWADLVEEAEIGISPLKFAGRSWADIAEEEDRWNGKKFEFGSHGGKQRSGISNKKFEQERRSWPSDRSPELIGGGGKRCEDSDYLSGMGGGYSCGKQRNRLQVFKEITPGDAKA